MTNPVEEAMKKRTNARQTLQTCNERIEQIRESLDALASELRGNSEGISLEPGQHINLLARTGHASPKNTRYYVKVNVIEELMELIASREQAKIDITHAEKNLTELGYDP